MKCRLLSLLQRPRHLGRAYGRGGHRDHGFSIPTVLSFIIAIGLISGAVLMTTMNNLFMVGENVRRQQAFNIAEAGVNYYLWHLAHNNTDYKDGTGAPATPDPTLGFGPYTHDYVGSDAVKQGTFTLWIKPQSVGSTVAMVRSIGKTKDGTTTRTVDAQIGATSFASYGLLANTEVWFGESETASGPVFSNRGVRMDGPSTDTVGSGNAVYTPSGPYGGDGNQHSGVWCSSSVPTCATRDKTNWQFPLPAVDFTQVDGTLCTMKKIAFSNDNATLPLAALNNACQQTPNNRTSAYIPRHSSNSFTTSRGYMIELNINNTYNLYRVNAENDDATSYANALSRTAVQSNIPIPSSGVIFAEDNVWVRTNPTYHGRLTIAAGRLGSTTDNADINIVDNLRYSVKNGSDVIGLIAERNIVVSPYAPPATGAFTFEVNAAALARFGSVKWPSTYKTNPGTCTRGWVNSDQKFEFYGSVATYGNWTWNYITGGCNESKYDPATGWYISGIKNTNTVYDYNLLFAPPPSFPITGGYNVISWREVLTRP